MNHCPLAPTVAKSLIVFDMPAVVVSMAVALTVLVTGLPIMVEKVNTTLLVSDIPDVEYVVEVCVVNVKPKSSKKLDCK